LKDVVNKDGVDIVRKLIYGGAYCVVVMYGHINYLYYRLQIKISP